MRRAENGICSQQKYPSGRSWQTEISLVLVYFGLGTESTLLANEHYDFLA
jgi:hypothetical protein